MRKLRLSLDDLRVESFSAEHAITSRGTVGGMEDCDEYDYTRCDCPTAGQCSNYCTPGHSTCVESRFCATQGAENTCWNTCYAGFTCPGNGCGGGGTLIGETCGIACNNTQ